MDNARAEKALRSYSTLAGFDWRDEEMDLRNYDMSQRLKLADIVASDGNKTVADLGSQYGGMSYALKDCGLDVVSVERYDGRAFPFLPVSEKPRPSHFDGLKKVNEGGVVKCDAFKLPLRHLDALVSYMFLGDQMWYKLRSGRKMAKVFDELSKSADVIYSVEPRSEYSEWFDGTATKKMLLSERMEMSANRKTLEPPEIEMKLRKALRGWDVEYVGEFGAYVEKSQDYVISDLTGDLKGDIKADVTEHTTTRTASRTKYLRTPERTVDRIGFKFTKKKASSSSSAVHGKEPVYRILSLFGRSKK